MENRRGIFLLSLNMWLKILPPNIGHFVYTVLGVGTALKVELYILFIF